MKNALKSVLVVCCLGVLTAPAHAWWHKHSVQTVTTVTTVRTHGATTAGFVTQPASVGASAFNFQPAAVNVAPMMFQTAAVSPMVFQPANFVTTNASVASTPAAMTFALQPSSIGTQPLATTQAISPQNIVDIINLIGTITGALNKLPQLPGVGNLPAPSQGGNQQLQTTLDSINAKLGAIDADLKLLLGTPTPAPAPPPIPKPADNIIPGVPSTGPFGILGAAVHDTSTKVDTSLKMHQQSASDIKKINDRLDALGQTLQEIKSALKK